MSSTNSDFYSKSHFLPYSDQIITVRISAVRAIRGFCEHLRSPAPPPLPPAAASPGAAAEGSPEHQQQQQQMRRSSSAEYRAGLLTPVLPAALDALIGMSATFSHSSDMLGLVLENLAVVVDVSYLNTQYCHPIFLYVGKFSVTLHSPPNTSRRSLPSR